MSGPHRAGTPRPAARYLAEPGFHLNQITGLVGYANSAPSTTRVNAGSGRCLGSTERTCGCRRHESSGNRFNSAPVLRQWSTALHMRWVSAARADGSCRCRGCPWDGPNWVDDVGHRPKPVAAALPVQAFKLPRGGGGVAVVGFGIGGLVDEMRESPSLGTMPRLTC
jgi:hypothetical protein